MYVKIVDIVLAILKGHKISNGFVYTWTSEIT